MMKNIVVVDKNNEYKEFLRYFFKTYLRNKCYELYETSSANEAYKICKNKNINLLICSRDLDDMRGEELAKKIRLEDYDYFMIIVITIEKEDKIKKSELNSNWFYIRKPIDIQKITAILKGIFNED